MGGIDLHETQKGELGKQIFKTKNNNLKELYDLVILSYIICV